MPHLLTPCSTALRRPRSRALARLATAAAATAILVAGAPIAGAADTGSSSGSSGVDPRLDRSATITHGNLSITREVVGNNIGVTGDTVTYRTKFSAADGPARDVTAILEGGNTTYGKPPLALVEATVTYTDPSGGVVTEQVSPEPDRAAVGAWPVDASTGATVVYESTYRFSDPAIGNMIGYNWYWPTKNVDNWIEFDATGLETLRWDTTGVQVTCRYSCSTWFSLRALPPALFGSSDLGPKN